MNDKNLSDLDELLKKANEVKDEVSSSTFEQKNKALKEAAQSLNDSRETLKSANDLDMEDASKKDLLESFIDRLKLNEQRIDSMISGINKVIDFFFRPLNFSLSARFKPIHSPSISGIFISFVQCNKRPSLFGRISVGYEKQKPILVKLFEKGFKDRAILS